MICGGQIYAVSLNKTTKTNIFSKVSAQPQCAAEALCTAGVQGTQRRRRRFRSGASVSGRRTAAPQPAQGGHTAGGSFGGSIPIRPASPRNNFLCEIIPIFAQDLCRRQHPAPRIGKCRAAAVSATRGGMERRQMAHRRKRYDQRQMARPEAKGRARTGRPARKRKTRTEAEKPACRKSPLTAGRDGAPD